MQERRESETKKSKMSFIATFTYTNVSMLNYHILTYKHVNLITVLYMLMCVYAY
jgi:hypothetical protein